MAGAMQKMITDDGGKHPVPTLGGCTLSASYENGKMMLTDENGNVAKVTIADVKQSHGVIHVIDKVLLPEDVSGTRDGDSFPGGLLAGGSPFTENGSCHRRVTNKAASFSARSG